MPNLVSVVIPLPLRDRARFHHLNISAVCRKALLAAVKKVEKEGNVGVKFAARTPASTGQHLAR